jgi:hypothetical protein
MGTALEKITLSAVPLLPFKSSFSATRYPALDHNGQQHLMFGAIGL